MTSSGRRILVTGAASGLGAALTRAFRGRGDDVLATDRAEGPEPVDLRLDVTSDADWASGAAEVERRWGALDVLVNNAGIAGGGRLDRTTMDEWRRITDVNLLGVARGLRTFVPVFKRQRSGTIVNVASLAGLVHPGGMGSYNAVKAAVVALTETAGHELAPYGVRAVAVCPSYFRTRLTESATSTDRAVASVVGRLVDESPYSADDIAAAVLSGLDEGAELILPDEPARAAWSLKQSDRAGYDALMRAQAAKLQGA
jgi:NAD(P)-dependent dehydrogenase (short-subunit alcohol dehydrogenase family)